MPTRRNVELKAIDRDPETTLSRALGAGAEDRGTLQQRDTYFAVGTGRLKLREQDGPEGREAVLVAYRRADEASARLSAYHLVPVPDAEALRTALSDVPGVRTVVEKRRRLLVWEGTVRIHLDEVAGLEDRYVEIEAVADPASDLGREHEQLARLSGLLGVGEVVDASYADLVAAAAPDAELLAMARAVRANAHVPYSRFAVGAALRTTDGRRYAGANVENAAYPEGDCAETAALGAMVSGGGGRVAEVVVVGEGERLVTPCGGCRQRLREFCDDNVPVHMADDRRVRRTATLAELLPLSFEARNL